MFLTMTCIRVLDLSSTTISELPQSIDKWKLLRYLDLSKTEIQRLPNSLCNLFNLQTLKLLGCLRLFELPKDLGRLVNLQHLELDDMFWHKVTRLPPRMGKLSRLHNLHVFHTSSEEEGYGIEQLKGMKNLTGTLRISKLENVANATEARLNQKERLDKLVLEWSRDRALLTDDQPETMMLEDLQPHSNLKHLQICHYRGATLPVLMKDGLLQNLVTVSLKNCTNCRVLLLGPLPHLRQLYIKGMQELEDWPHEVELSSLDTLNITNCRKLRDLHSFFPNLRVLNIKRCDSLKSLAVTPSLMFLILVENPVLEDWREALVTFSNSSDDQPIGHLHSYQHLLELKIICCPKVSTLPRLFAPQKLEISECALLTALPVPGLSQRLQHLALEACQDGTLVEAIPETTSLYSLVISNISNITSLPKLPHLPGLKALYIHDCKHLVSLSTAAEEAAPLQHLTSLQLLSIQSCHELVRLPAEGLGNKLECLMLRSCPNLDFFGPPDVFKRLTSLKDLYIEGCPKLKCFPEEGVPPSLAHLVIQGCPQLMEQCRKEPQEGSDWTKVKEIPDLEIDSINNTLGLRLPPESTPSSSPRWYRRHLGRFKGQTSKGK